MTIKEENKELISFFREYDETGKDPYCIKYEKFNLLDEWNEYAKSLPLREHLRFKGAILLYATYGKRRDNLKPKTAIYLDKNVIPELDRQHELLRKGGRI